MADNVVHFLLENMDSLVKQELSTADEAGDRIKTLFMELLLINNILNNFKGKDEEDEWVSLVRSVSDRAEAIIDTFVINIDKHKRRNTDKKFRHRLEHGRMLQSVIKDTESITNELTTIYSIRERCMTENREGDDDHTHERITPMICSRGLVEENDVVNFENHAEPMMEVPLIKGG
ncbi:hypothetical protein LguiA_017836 [Lonicera macranthoides]